jgi:hypothetical protein
MQDKAIAHTLPLGHGRRIADYANVLQLNPPSGEPRQPRASLSLSAHLSLNAFKMTDSPSAR